MPYILLHALTCAVYAGLALHFWRTRWSARPAPAARERAGGLRGWERAALLLPLVLHGWLLYADVVAPAQPRFGFAHALSAMLWLAVLFYWVESFFYNLEGMQAPVLALAALTAPLPAFFPGYATTHAASLEFKLHLVLAMLAYSLFTIAILHALLMAVLERRLHGARKGPIAIGEPLGPLRGPFASLPPLLTLERLLFRLIGAAFALLTLTLATGIIFSESLFGRPIRFDHKSVFAVVSWLTFAALLIGRHYYGWRGRTALRWTLAGFVLLLLAYVGSRFVLEVVLGRGAT
ncbi:MAG TPA: cytochrome c biogenesis protein CcsA [Burkholderiales bacterium]|nr:cytochrome c biogenesis protein CcsA [Burkholderiales bacterium]